ncbi:MAG: LysR substrate-binding domain-containing protein [Desulfonatronovibrionaceae bacterium]
MKMRDLDIDLLRTFKAVAECRNFTGAALRMSLTQSAVSAQVRRLEELLGQRLFERNSKRVILTESGATLMDYASRILELHDSALEKMGRPRVEGRIRLGMPDDYASYFLPRVLSRFGRMYPGVQLEICCELSVDLHVKLEKGQLDVALLTQQKNSLGGEVVCSEPLVWATARGGHVHEQRPLPLALFPPGFCFFREQALKALSATGKSWRIVCTSRSMSGIRAAVSAGLAVTVVGRHTMSADMCMLGEEEGFPKLPNVGIALHAGDDSCPEQVRRLSGFLKEEMGQIGRDAPSAA